MAQEKMRQAHVDETGESTFAVNIEVSGHHIKGDEPVEAGGGNLGPSPFDLLLAALGECTAMTVRWYARRQNWPLDKVEVKLTHHKEGKVNTYTKQVILHGDQLTEEQRSKLVDAAAKCPVHRALEATPIITTTLAG
ncbi:MAG: osmotically inducible protein OsmC [Rickettsiales bacterium]|jgi:putative redox protein|nr:osmotically inducible protein OsmC [Rickettsiales bacterium]